MSEGKEQEDPTAQRPAPKVRTAGFRFSVVDGVAIAACALGVYGLRELMLEFVWLLPFALGHFFLFCNVFRVRRNYELTWTALFLVNFCAWFFAGEFSWAAVLAVQTPVTAIAIAAEMRSPRYHGICARTLNSRLDEYLDGATPH
jgi:hypothetical protein